MSLKRNLYIESPAELTRHLRHCEADSHEMCDDAARAVAANWHGGQASAMYAFASSGHYDRQGLLAELSETIAASYPGASIIDRRQLNFFGTYLIAREET